MMSQQQARKVVITLQSGRVAVMGFITVGRGPGLPHGAQWLDQRSGWWRREPTEANVFQEVMRACQVGEQPSGYRILPEGEDVPQDRTYRDAWADTGEEIQHDMRRARAVHLGRLRARRGAKLEELDREWMRATGQGNAKEAERVEGERQALRDLPVTLELDKIDNVDDLKKAWPENLPR